MSHFTVLVVGENPEEQLAPYQENNMGDCPKQYLKFFDQEQEFQDEWKNKKTKAVLVDGKYLFPWDEKFRVSGKFGYGTDTHKVPDHLKIEEVPFNKIYSSFTQFVHKYHSREHRDKEKNRYGYWENPNAKWDGYTLGGRWTGFFKLKPGKDGVIGKKSWTNESKEIEKDRVDQARKKDIDFAGMVKANRDKAIKNYEEFEALMKSNPEKAAMESYWKWGIENKGDKDNYVPESREEYVTFNTMPTTFAVLKDGKWYEKGNMGWWAIVSNEKDPNEWTTEFCKMIDELPEDTLLSVVDCHI